MLKPVLILVLLVVFGVGGFFLYQNLQTKPAPQLTPTPQIAKTPSPTQVVPTTSLQPTLTVCQILEQGSADVPPLYKEGLTWQQPTMTEYEVPLAEGSQQMKGCLITTSQTSLDSSDQVRDGYTKELEAKKWEIESAGDMPDAGFVTWKKNKSYVVLRINSVNGNSNFKTVTLFYTGQ
jgi:hypothetical protein